MAEDHFVMQQRRMIHNAINDAIRPDPELQKYSAFVKGWILVLDITGLTSEDDESVIEEVRAQPNAWCEIWSSDATGETDLTELSGEGMLWYAATHYDDIYDSRATTDSEHDGD